jgi:hypothetical protein
MLHREAATSTSELLADFLLSVGFGCVAKSTKIQIFESRKEATEVSTRMLVIQCWIGEVVFSDNYAAVEKDVHLFTRHLVTKGHASSFIQTAGNHNCSHASADPY